METNAVKINNAVSTLRAGGVIAYPTEYCFGLGCDPKNTQAVDRLLAIKQRQKEQGVILIAANIEQVNQYADLSSIVNLDRVTQSWPGPNTWILPVKASTSYWLKGQHSSIAMRISAYSLCQQLCVEFGGAIVSTSANRHGHQALLNGQSVLAEFSNEVDYVLDAPIQFDTSKNSPKASTIRDAITGEQLR
jgi:L-threonylcarbamoyladenylate synthase